MEPNFPLFLCFQNHLAKPKQSISTASVLVTLSIGTILIQTCHKTSFSQSICMNESGLRTALNYTNCHEWKVAISHGFEFLHPGIFLLGHNVVCSSFHSEEPKLMHDIKNDGTTVNTRIYLLDLKIHQHLKWIKAMTMLSSKWSCDMRNSPHWNCMGIHY